MSSPKHRAGGRRVKFLRAAAPESQKIIAPYFEAQGFVWGKVFGDAMHFQYCTGY